MSDIPGLPWVGWLPRHGSRSRFFESILVNARHPSDLHGPRHWAHVGRLGMALADLLALDEAQRACVGAFAWCHDLGRETDAHDASHGARAAAMMRELLPALFPWLDQDQRVLVTRAIRDHTAAGSVRDTVDAEWCAGIGWPAARISRTVACCWDADRLDLLRLGIDPLADRMSTPVWRCVLPLAERLNRWSE